jgi:hypothetical protein
LKLFLLIGIICVFQFAAYSQTAVPVEINQVYLAKDNGSGQAGDPATSFVPTDVPIYCVVQLESAIPTTVKMNLVAENVPGVKPETHVVSTSYTTKDGENRVNFNGRPAGKWVPGKYRAEIYVDGKLAKNLPFEIKGNSSAASSSSSFAPNTTKPKKPVAAKPRKRTTAPFTTDAVFH